MTDLKTWATWREIYAQPLIWKEWGQDFGDADLRGWIAAQTFDEVWFCGAGTSAYIGDIILAGLEGKSVLQLRSVPTTDIVARPQAYLGAKRPLVVNFGRSGNSAESIGTLDALDALAPSAPRLNITCNAEGALAVRKSKGPSKVILLPDATHDAGFAMTSSFSTMLLSALALFGPDTDFAAQTLKLSKDLEALLPLYAQAAGPAPSRAVYVGTGPLAFAAREAALKVMELSAGAIPALWDSCLGFRHGPKSFVTDDTAITVFASQNNPYDRDLIAELRAQYPKTRITAIGPNGDIKIDPQLDPVWAAPLYVAAAQVSGVIWSHAMGLNVDDPFVGQGTLSRVVSGVTLYPVAS